MTLIRIKTGEYYDKPEFYPYMPESVFSALEAAELAGSETAEVEDTEFQKMMDGFNESKKR